MDDLMTPLTPPTPTGATGRRCRRHDWTGPERECRRCGKARDVVRSSRGRRNRERGNEVERWVCGLLGIARVGQYGTAEDGGTTADWIRVQVKSGGTYPERIDGLLRAITTTSDQLAAVVHVDAPGSGHHRRALITLDLREFARWYGGGDDSA